MAPKPKAKARDFYATLGLDRENKPTATQIKKAYHQMALRYHPDKYDGADAEERFKEIYRAYDVLSSEEKRSIYNQFGEEGLSEEGYGEWSANEWNSIYRGAWLTKEMIDEYLKEYKGSDKEVADLKALYEKYKGNMDQLYERHVGYEVEEEGRIRSIIQGLIDAGEVAAYPLFVNEPSRKKAKRHALAKKEEKEAEEALAELQKRGKAPAGGVDGESALALAIQQNAKKRGEDFFDQLLAKYGGGAKSGRAASTSKQTASTKKRQSASKKANRNASVAEEVEGRDEDESEADAEPLQEPNRAKRSKKMESLESKKPARANGRPQRKAAKN